MDRSRIDTHIKPLLGSRLVSGLTLRDIEGMQADIAAGKSARGRKEGRGGRSTGGLAWPAGPSAPYGGCSVMPLASTSSEEIRQRALGNTLASDGNGD